MALPISTPNTDPQSFYSDNTPRTAPMHRRLQRDDGVRRNLQTEDPALVLPSDDLEASQLGNGTPEKSILASILSSQKQMQKMMEQVLHRVDALENSVKPLKESSVPTEEKKSMRLSSELCVSL